MKFRLLLSPTDTWHGASSGAAADLWSILPSLEIKPALLISTPLISHIIHMDLCQLSAACSCRPEKRNPLAGHFIIFCPHINGNPEAGTAGRVNGAAKGTESFHSMERESLPPTLVPM